MEAKYQVIVFIKFKVQSSMFKVQCSMFKVKRLSLYELNSIVSEIISMSLPDSYWVEAELSEAREGYGGHCYLELIQKDERSNTPIAKAHANCWRNRWMLIKPNFERVTGQRIHAGM